MLENFMQQAQQQMEESKKRLNDVFVEAEAEGGLVKVKANGNKKIVNLSISEDLVKDGDKDAIEDLVLLAVNRAIEQAENISQAEMSGVAQTMMPDLGGLLGR